MLRHLLLAAALIGAPQALWAEDVASQKGVIVADVAAPWLHVGSGISIPPRIGSFVRGTIQQNGENQLDVAIGYEAPETHTTLTVYLFHAWLPQAPVWFDRIDAAMHSPQSNARLGGMLDADPIITPFAPTGQSAATALRSAYAMTGNRVKATGSAALPAGEWLVTIRMSSTTMDKAGLDAAIAEAAAAIATPKPKREVEPAQPIAVCKDAMPLKAAKRAKPEMMDSLLAGIGMLGGDTDDKNADPSASPEKDAAKSAADAPAKPVVWCRDSSSKIEYGVYRDSSGDTPGYLIALGDAGIAAEVTPSLAGLISGHKRFSVALHLLDRDFSFAPFTTLPTPEQVFAVVQNDQPISSSDRSGNISVSVPN